MSDFSVNIGPRYLRQGGSTAQVLSAVVPDPPHAIRALDSGTILKGIVQGRDPDGATIIATDKGALRVPVSPPPPVGSAVTLEVRIAGGRLQVLILSSEPSSANSARHTLDADDSLHQSSTRLANLGAAAIDQASEARSPSGALPAAVTMTTGNVVEAIFIRLDAEAVHQILTAKVTAEANALDVFADTQGNEIDSEARPALARSEPSPNKNFEGQKLRSFLQPEIKAQILALFRELQVPAQGSQNPAPLNAETEIPRGSSKGMTHVLAALLQSASAALSSSAIRESSTGSWAGPWNTLANGADIRIRISIAQAPVVTFQPGFEKPGMDPAVVIGHVMGHTPSGGTIIATQFGVIVLRRHLALPVGGTVQLTLESQISAGVAQTAPIGPPVSAQQMLLQASHGWPTLIEVIALLRGRMVGGSTSEPTPRLARVGSGLTAGILRMMRAVREGDVDGLLGVSSAAIRRGDIDIEEVLGRLHRDLGQLSQFANERAHSDWRCFFLPLWDEGVLRQINLFHRHTYHDRRDGKAAKASGSRFVVEVELSRMGAFQFDGLVQNRRFDLVVRTQINLSPSARSDIAALYREAMELGEYSGDITFQTVRTFPVAPLDEIARHATEISA